MNKEIEFSITTTWDGHPLGHNPVEFTVSAMNNDFVKVGVRGPFFNDPGAPVLPPGSPCPELWEYEVAEIFFLGADDKYLEVELCPHGQHLVLLLNGTRNIIKDKLALEYTAAITDEPNKTWQGTAIIPVDYFPPEVGKINAYAIHGSGEYRQYEALYPATTKFHTPDFHRLQFFKDFAFKALFPATWKQPQSSFWA
ncbi:UPF0462 protein C4orf33 homolog isoform X1 [Montipora capricornis]|uniref:UPF0462 protein C4orf33 homolog isoform X1 n=2 Tax=Montipora capricornis TaxID=246305 RepID=UPI0035F1FFB9